MQPATSAFAMFQTPAQVADADSAAGMQGVAESGAAAVASPSKVSLQSAAAQPTAVPRSDWGFVLDLPSARELAADAAARQHPVNYEDLIESAADLYQYEYLFLLFSGDENATLGSQHATPYTNHLTKTQARRCC